METTAAWNKRGKKKSLSPRDSARLKENSYGVWVCGGLGGGGGVWGHMQTWSSSLANVTLSKEPNI